MFLFIFESIGTSELIMVGIVALMFLGPRKLPELARKAGKILADLRSTTNDFKSTWEREVNFEAEEKALKTGEIDEKPVAQFPSIMDKPVKDIPAPAIKSIDKESFDATQPPIRSEANEVIESPKEESELSDKRNWF
ncbi:MAG: Sec-independent protein translocase protein TatB [Pyrinomonadaceae bacterium]